MIKSSTAADTEGNLNPFDLMALAKLASQGLTRLVDLERKGLTYFIGEWRANPPRAVHNFWDYGDGSGRLLDALTLCAIMSKPDLESKKATTLIEDWVLRQFGADGLSWVPNEPWAKPWGDDALFVHPVLDGEFCEVSWSQRGSLMGMLSKYLSTADSRYLEKAKRHVDGLLNIAVKHVDGLYFPDVYYQNVGWQTLRHDIDPVMVEYNAAILPALVRLYEVTKYEPARELAIGITNFALLHTKGYGPNGEFLVPEGNLSSHFHTRSNFVLGVLKLGIVEEIKEHIAWAKSSYDQLRNLGTDFGWFPEAIGGRHGELCCTTVMIEIALLLGQHVERNYFADAERYGRNHLIESQWRSLPRLLSAVSKLKPPPSEESEFPDYFTLDNVPERQIGAFCSRPALNDGFHLDATALMQCCNGAGARALYDLWRYAIEVSETETPVKISINLRMSVETPLMRVVSHEPAKGMLEVTPKIDCNVHIRVPEGTDSALLRVPGNAEQNLKAVDGYVNFSARSDELVQIQYTLQERQVEYRVGSNGREDIVQGFWRGETLMKVDPPGSFYPFYLRDDDIAPVLPALASGKAIDSI